MKRDERFEVLATIQEGMLATSYRARDRVLDRTVLLKVLHPRKALDEDTVQRFRREAMLQARLRHPNIVTVYDFGSEDDFYIASEFIEGETFEARLRKSGRLSVQELAPLVVQVAHALRYAHAQGVVHRDLKPANIMIDAHGDAKLTDFGLAFARDLGSLTQEGSVVGTPAYMSPEQSRGRKTDVRTDMFSLGIVIYEALVGANPFKADTLADSLSLVLNKDPKPLEQALPGVPAELAQLVARMLVKDPEKRNAAIADVLDVFTSVGPVSVAPRPRSLSLALVAVAVVAVAVALLFSRSSSRAAGPAPAALDSLTRVPLTIAPDSSAPETAAGDPAIPGPARRETTPGGMATLDTGRAPAVPQLCSLRLTVTPWADVMVDGRDAGTTPLTGPLVLAPGPHVIELKNPYFPTVRKTVTLTAASASISWDLNREVALADIRVTPWAEVSIDGRVVDTTPLGRPIPLSLGAHLLTVFHPDYGTRSESIRTDSAMTYRFSYDLTRN